MKWNQKFDTELLKKLAKESDQHICSLRKEIRELGLTLGVNVDKLALVRSMESFAEERGIKLC